MISNCLAPFYAAFHGIPQSVFESFHEQMDLRAVFAELRSFAAKNLRAVENDRERFAFTPRGY